MWLCVFVLGGGAGGFETRQILRLFTPLLSLKNKEFIHTFQNLFIIIIIIITNFLRWDEIVSIGNLVTQVGPMY